ncbi:MAG: hypothetical protein HFI90_02815 [Clostridia bacterium]|nr:hypothetical protein [Clostridia bacterium]
MFFGKKHKNCAYMQFSGERVKNVQVFLIAREHPIGGNETQTVKITASEKLEHAKRGEIYPFQLFVKCKAGESGGLSVAFSDLKGKNGIIGKDRCAALPQDKTDIYGKEHHETIPVCGKTVIWCYVDVPADAKGGNYSGTVQLLLDGETVCNKKIQISVDTAAAKTEAQDHPETFSRLHWFNSKTAQDGGVTAPYTPVQVDGKTARVLGRGVTVNEYGLPERVYTEFNSRIQIDTDSRRELLENAMSFSVKTCDGAERIFPVAYTDSASEETYGFTGKNGMNDFRVEVNGRVEFDGYCYFDAAFTALKKTRVTDIALEIPFALGQDAYFMGLGKRGGKMPQEINFRWGEKVHQDSFWIGYPSCGARFQFMDETYVRPHVNIYYHYQPLRLPDGWYNGGRGGIYIGADRHARIYSGERTFRQGETVHFCFSMLVTPLKPIDTKTHFASRYYQTHGCEEPQIWLEEMKKTGANVLNIHHGTDLNPYINYPFYETEALKNFAAEVHKLGGKCKIYNTVRELSTKMKELPVLQSLGSEIFAASGGKEGATLWQKDAKEQVEAEFGKDVIAAWREDIKHGKHKGEADASLLTSGTSRMCNYYIEGLRYLVEKTDIDGIYIDDTAYGRETMKRVRRVLDKKEGALVDMHSWDHKDARAGQTSSLLLYMELFPYINELWIGEGFDYETTPPEEWLVEMSGIPFGLMGEMLQGGGNFYRGLVFGETARYGWTGTPEAIPELWKLYDKLDVPAADFYGWWDNNCPVKAEHDGILVSCWQMNGKALIAAASWAKEPVRVKLDYSALPFQVKKVTAPLLTGHQKQAAHKPADTYTIKPASGILLIAE